MSAFGLTPLLTNAANAAELTPTELLDYARPGRLARLPDGRRINLMCQGAGPVTVVIEPGGGSWSLDARMVVRELAGRTRVCAYDRAGHGFSDPAAEPITAQTVQQDLHASLSAAKISAPYVLVGHSQGGEYIRAFRDAHPDEVAGMVFLDVGGPERSAMMGQVDPEGQKSADAWLIKTVETCIRLSRDGSLAKGVRDPEFCVDDPPKDWPQALRTAYVANQVKVGHHIATLADLQDFDLEPLRPGAYGDMPVAVLTATSGLNQSIPAETREKLNQVKIKFGDMLAAQSSRGRQVLLADTPHYVMAAAPKEVAALIMEVVDQTQAK